MLKAHSCVCRVFGRPERGTKTATKWRALRYGCLTMTGIALGGHPAVVRGQDFSGVGKAATVISSVAVTRDTQRTAIRIEGAGHLEVHATRIQNPERLALDFTGARLKVQKTSIPGVSAPVRGVRMGQFRPDVARVVIDLTASVPYQIAHEGNSAVVYLQVQPSDTNAPPAIASAASEKPQKQIGVTPTTPPTNSISIINERSNAATAPLSSSNELTQPSTTSATTNTVSEPSSMENGGDFSRSPAKSLPTGTILLKGAWSSASDSVTPVPEGGSVNNSVYNNPYFGLRYTLGSPWTQKYSGPPPSDSGYYVLAQIRPVERSELTVRGSILIAAQDLFFTPNPSNAVKLIQEINDNLEPDYKVELPPTVVQLANHPFVRFDYGSPVADLHWHILATQVRCHVLEFIFTSRDAKLVEGLIRGMNMIELPKTASTAGETDESNVPVCIKDYASGENVIERVDPIIIERRFNSILVRIIIDKEGKVKHIHFLSAFPDQTKVITDALLQWKFRPYMRNGRPAEVETGIMFGIPPPPVAPPENPLRE
jgi:hypothetical protein